MASVISRYTAAIEELANRWREVSRPGAASEVALLTVPPGWGRSHVLHELAGSIESDEGPVTLLVQIDGRVLPDDIGMQAKLVCDLLGQATSHNRAAQLLGLDRLGGRVQLGIGLGGLFASGLAAVAGFLLAGVAVGAASTAWDTSTTGQEGMLARIARSVAAVSVTAPVMVILDDADRLNPDLVATLMENLIGRPDGRVLVAAAVDPGSGLADALRSRTGYQWAGLVHQVHADPDMSYRSRVDLAGELCPGLALSAIQRIAQRTRTFADIFSVASAERLTELSGDEDSAVLSAVDAVINSRLQRPQPSAEAVVVTWAGGLVHVCQAERMLSVLGASHKAGDVDLLRLGSLVRIADPASPRLAEHVLAIASAVRVVLAAGILEEALSLAAEETTGLVDRVAALQAAHRVRADTPAGARTRLVEAQRLLVAGLEALGDLGPAYQVAIEALAEGSAGGSDREDRESLAAAVIRLAQADRRHVDDPLVREAVAAAAVGGAVVGLEARVWAAVDLLNQRGHHDEALNLVDRIVGALKTGERLGEPADYWRLLLAFHAGRAGYPMITQELLRPLVNGDSTQLQDAANAIIYAVGGPNADTRLQNLILEAELDTDSGRTDDEPRRLHHTLAANYARLGDYRRALEHAHHELELLRAREAPPRATLDTRQQIAFWTSEAGDLPEALRLANELLLDQLTLLGPLNADTLANRSNIAIWSARLGQAPALPTYQKLLSDVLTFLGPRHIGAMTIRANIASAMARSGNRAEAARMLSGLLNDEIEVLGPRHEKTLHARDQIAAITDDPVQALRLYRELLRDQIQVLGSDRPETLQTRQGMAIAMCQAGDVPGSLRELRMLLTDQKRVNGPDHPQTLSTRRQIAVVTSRMSAADALRLLEELLPDLERVLGAQDPSTQDTIADIATLASTSAPSIYQRTAPKKHGRKSKKSTSKRKRKPKK
jgi:tetratricopeptide (TPR) repeat protein